MKHVTIVKTLCETPLKGFRRAASWPSRASRWIALGGIALSVTLPAQQAPPTSQQPTFRIRVELVELDVVVTDKQDRPVKDLTKDNFEIVERGRVQTLANF